VEIDEQVIRPAGKSLNISYALAWMGVQSIAAGLWGREDYDRMQAATARLGGLIQAQMTPAEGRTRQNTTIVDTARHREMHLRLRSRLACGHSLDRLNTDLGQLVREGDICVFAGAMPAGTLLEPAVNLARTCRKSHAWVVVDTHGPALERIVQEGLSRLIAPNVQELRELLGTDVKDEPARLVEAGRTLLNKTGMVMISRGEKGAVLATADGAWMGRSQTRREAISTVGCGDSLLAGFLAEFGQSSDPAAALTTGLKLAAARAWGWTEGKTWRQVEQEVAIEIETM